MQYNMRRVTESTGAAAGPPAGLRVGPSSNRPVSESARLSVGLGDARPRRWGGPFPLSPPAREGARAGRHGRGSAVTRKVSYDSDLLGRSPTIRPPEGPKNRAATLRRGDAAPAAAAGRQAPQNVKKNRRHPPPPLPRTLALLEAVLFPLVEEVRLGAAGANAAVTAVTAVTARITVVARGGSTRAHAQRMRRGTRVDLIQAARH